MSNIQIFENKEFGRIRTIEKNNQVYFIGNDVASILGYERTAKAILDHVEQEDKDVVPIQDSIGRMQNTAIINESGFYSLVLSSKLPSARRFKRWVTSEVLPSIRKNGGYIANQENLSDSELMAKALLVAQNTINSKNKQLEEAQKKIKEDSGKVLYANCLTKKSAILVGEMATILAQNGMETGEKRFFQWLRDNGYLNKTKGREHNKPTQKSIELGVMRFTKTVITHSNGYQDTRITPLITGKGQIYFIDKFREYLNT